MKKIYLFTLMLGAFSSFGRTTNGGTGSATGGTDNSFLGSYSGTNTTGSNNTFVENYAGYSNTKGIGNTFLGRSAGYKNNSNYNTFIRRYSGYNTTTAMGNSFLVFLAGYKNTTGGFNAFSGYQTGYDNTTGIGNVFLGHSAGRQNSTGSKNVFIDFATGYYEVASNRLYIDNSSTTTPLIYGKFDTDQLGINTNNIPTGYALAVKGKMITEEVKVTLQGTTGWPDYVFNTDYQLLTLKEVGAHIKEKGHLKDIPSAEEVAENRLLLGEMNAKLLQKIEELTLYTIQQEKKLEEQQLVISHPDSYREQKAISHPDSYREQKANSQQQEEIDELKKIVKQLITKQ